MSGAHRTHVLIWPQINVLAHAGAHGARRRPKRQRAARGASGGRRGHAREGTSGVCSAHSLHASAASARPSGKVCAPPAKKPTALGVAPGALTPPRARPCSPATAGPRATYHEGQGPLPGDDADESRQQHLGRQTCGTVRRPDGTARQPPRPRPPATEGRPRPWRLGGAGSTPAAAEWSVRPRRHGAPLHPSLLPCLHVPVTQAPAPGGGSCGSPSDRVTSHWPDSHCK